MQYLCQYYMFKLTMLLFVYKQISTLKMSTNVFQIHALNLSRLKFATVWFMKIRILDQLLLLLMNNTCHIRVTFALLFYLKTDFTTLLIQVQTECTLNG